MGANLSRCTRALSGTMSVDGLTLKDAARVKELIASIQSAKSRSGWVLLGHETDKTIKLVAHGTGGVAEVLPHLDQTDVQYGLVRLRTDVVDGGLEHASEIATKDISFTVKGKQLSIKRRARGLLGETICDAFLSPHHSRVEVLDSDKLNDATLLQRATGSGSHVIE